MRDAVTMDSCRAVLPGDDHIYGCIRIDSHAEQTVRTDIQRDRDDVAVASVDRDIEIAYGDLLRTVDLLPFREQRHRKPSRPNRDKSNNIIRCRRKTNSGASGRSRSVEYLHMRG